ncbi:hypothetical protein VTP01DRAFT_6084 [Rhizomucor pusillus]|uniref:uncharacterized protein n=1 Tax=Rhizomucor pusillus TaxID=4840 RepID=UPI00374245A3
MRECVEETYDHIELRIRSNEGPDLVFRVSPQDTVSSIKEKIRQTAAHARDRNIRLIHNGRILEDSRQLTSYGLGKFMRDPNSKAKIPPPLPIYIHCSLSEKRPANAAASSINTNLPQMTPAVGFDRLRDIGLSQEDIQVIRERFHQLHGTEGAENSELARNLEEQWIDNSTQTLPDGTVHGAYKEMLWGLILGFFLGVICLFWFKESVFTRRHQMGIIAGILINISFGILHVYY